MSAKKERKYNCPNCRHCGTVEEFSQRPKGMSAKTIQKKIQEAFPEYHVDIDDRRGGDGFVYGLVYGVEVEDICFVAERFFQRTKKWRDAVIPDIRPKWRTVQHTKNGE